MTRRAATVVGVALALAAAVGLVVLTGILAAERRADRERYAAALAAQRRSAGAPLRPPAEPGGDDAAITVCVRGVDTPVRAAQRTLQEPVVRDGRVEQDALDALSALAVRGQRYLELGRGAPALPQRMGRERVDSGAETEWRTLSPGSIECADGPAYGRFRVSPTGAK